MANFDNQVLWTAAGLDAIHVAKMRSSLFAGYSGLSAASTPNTGSGMRRLLGAQTAPFALPANVKKAIPGDDTIVDTFTFGSAEPSSGVLLLGIRDNDFDVAAEGTTANTVGIYDFYGTGDTIANPEVWMFLLTKQAHSKDSGSTDAAGWVNELWLSCKVQPLGEEQWAHQAENNFRYDTTFNQATKTPWGVSTTTAFGTAYRRAIRWGSLYRSMLHVWIADNSAVETTALDYTPIDAASTKAWNGTTGAALTVSSVNTSTKKPTLSAAPASGVPVVMLYQTASF